MKLKYTVVTKKVIELRDWNNLVKETYGKPYSFQQQDGCKDRGSFDFTVPLEDYPCDYDEDTNPMLVNGDEMGVSFKAWLAGDPTASVFTTTFGPLQETSESSSIELVWLRNFYPDVEMIIEDLYEKGLIEEGDYSIRIDW